MSDVKITIIKGTLKQRVSEGFWIVVLLCAGSYGASHPGSVGGSIASTGFGLAILGPIGTAFGKMARFRLHRWAHTVFKIDTDSGRAPEYACIVEKQRYSFLLPISFLLKAFIFRMVVLEERSGSSVVVDRTVGEFKKREWLIKPLGRGDSLRGKAASVFASELKALPAGEHRDGLERMVSSGLKIEE
jgi:hypothetical protein